MQYFLFEYCDYNGVSKLWEMKTVPSGDGKTKVQLTTGTGHEGLFEYGSLDYYITSGISADFAIQQLDVLIHEVKLKEQNPELIFSDNRQMRNTLVMTWRNSDEEELQTTKGFIYPDNVIDFDSITLMIKLISSKSF